jgi:hypothetical protein
VDILKRCVSKKGSQGRLAVVSEDILEGALRTAWKLRVQKNAKAGKKPVGRERGMAKNVHKER